MKHFIETNKVVCCSRLGKPGLLENICKEKVVDPRVLEVGLDMTIAFDSVEVSEGVTESGKLKEGSK